MDHLEKKCDVIEKESDPREWQVVRFAWSGVA